LVALSEAKGAYVESVASKTSLTQEEVGYVLQSGSKVEVEEALNSYIAEGKISKREADALLYARQSFLESEWHFRAQASTGGDMYDTDIYVAHMERRSVLSDMRRYEQLQAHTKILPKPERSVSAARTSRMLEKLEESGHVVKRGRYYHFNEDCSEEEIAAALGDEDKEYATAFKKLESEGRDFTLNHTIEAEDYEQATYTGEYSCEVRDLSLGETLGYYRDIESANTLMDSGLLKEGGAHFELEYGYTSSDPDNHFVIKDAILDYDIETNPEDYDANTLSVLRDMQDQKRASKLCDFAKTMSETPRDYDDDVSAFMRTYPEDHDLERVDHDEHEGDASPAPKASTDSGVTDFFVEAGDGISEAAKAVVESVGMAACALVAGKIVLGLGKLLRGKLTGRTARKMVKVYRQQDRSLQHHIAGLSKESADGDVLAVYEKLERMNSSMSAERQSQVSDFLREIEVDTYLGCSKEGVYLRRDELGLFMADLLLASDKTPTGELTRGLACQFDKEDPVLFLKRLQDCVLNRKKLNPQQKLFMAKLLEEMRDVEDPKYSKFAKMIKMGANEFELRDHFVEPLIELADDASLELAAGLGLTSVEVATLHSSGRMCRIIDGVAKLDLTETEIQAAVGSCDFSDENANLIIALIKLQNKGFIVDSDEMEAINDNPKLSGFLNGLGLDVYEYDIKPGFFEGIRTQEKSSGASKYYKANSYIDSDFFSAIESLSRGESYDQDTLPGVRIIIENGKLVIVTNKTKVKKLSPAVQRYIKKHMVYRTNLEQSLRDAFRKNPILRDIESMADDAEIVVKCRAERKYIKLKKVKQGDVSSLCVIEEGIIRRDRSLVSKNCLTEEDMHVLDSLRIQCLTTTQYLKRAGVFMAKGALSTIEGCKRLKDNVMPMSLLRHVRGHYWQRAAFRTTGYIAKVAGVFVGYGVATGVVSGSLSLAGELAGEAAAGLGSELMAWKAGAAMIALPMGFEFESKAQSMALAQRVDSQLMGEIDLMCRCFS